MVDGTPETALSYSVYVLHAWSMLKSTQRQVLDAQDDGKEAIQGEAKALD